MTGLQSRSKGLMIPGSAAHLTNIWKRMGYQIPYGRNDERQEEFFKSVRLLQAPDQAFDITGISLTQESGKG